MRIDEYESLLSDGTLQKKYFEVLKDTQWHCRDCAGKKIASTQIAGGGEEFRDYSEEQNHDQEL